MQARRTDAYADVLQAGLERLHARALAGDADAQRRLDRVHEILLTAQERMDNMERIKRAERVERGDTA